MKKILVTFFIVLMLSCNVFPDLMYISTEESVKTSDFIVVGTLQSISDIYQNDSTWGKINVGQEGILVIDEIVAGKVLNTDGQFLKSGDKLHLEWSEFSACLSGWHRRTENKKGIWLLKIDKTGAVETSHPAQFASFEEFSEIKKYIEKYSKKFSKPITIQNEENQHFISSESNKEVPKEITSESPTLSKPKSYSPFSALLVILASISLYYLLYRIRFKIR